MHQIELVNLTGVASFAEIKMEILKHGAGVEVIKPKALRDIIKKEAKKIERIY